MLEMNFSAGFGRYLAGILSSGVDLGSFWNRRLHGFGISKASPRSAGHGKTPGEE
jgi:hypothetical protein